MSGSSKWRGRALGYALALVALLGTVLILLGPATWLVAGNTVRAIAEPEKRNEQLNQTRDTLAKAIGVLLATGGAVGALFYTARTYYLTRRGQVTDRYAKAVAQLAHDDIVQRLGGIYALEHVMQESPQDHETVIELLAAYVRDKSPVAPERSISVPVTKDVTAAMTVLARRPHLPERNKIDLRHTNLAGLELLPDQDGRCPRLAGANLCGAHLTGVRMPGIDLRGALLAGADLTDADFTSPDPGTEADLSDAWLTGATLRRTQLKNALLVRAVLDGDAVLDETLFDGADLTEAWLNGAKPNHAHFSGTILKDTWLLDVDLEHCQSLTEKQLLEAGYLPSTTAPSHLERSVMLAQRAAASTDRPTRHRPTPRPFPWPLTPADRAGAAPRRRSGRLPAPRPWRPRR